MPAFVKADPNFSMPHPFYMSLSSGALAASLGQRSNVTAEYSVHRLGFPSYDLRTQNGQNGDSELGIFSGICVVTRNYFRWEWYCFRLLRVNNGVFFMVGKKIVRKIETSFGCTVLFIRLKAYQRQINRQKNMR